MRIALITHHWAPNFGANLQALATYRYLKQHHDVEVLHYLPPAQLERYQCIVSREQIDAHLQFCHRFLRLSPLLQTESEVERYCRQRQFETIVSGSDAIFRLSKRLDTIEGSFPNPYWLGWAKRHQDYLPRTGFIAGSVTGSAYYSFPSALKGRIVEEVKKADYVSVRDTWTRWMFMLLSRGEICPPISPDPVSILDTVFKIPAELEQKAESRAQPYVLYSARSGRVSRSWLRRFVDLCHGEGLAVYGLPLPEQQMPPVFDHSISLPLSPLEWYGWIKHASGYVGERFHPAVCALFNKVPFVAIDHYRKEGVKKRLRRMNFPVTSKVFDVCKRSGYASCCVNYPAFKKLAPQQVVAMLVRWDSRQAARYTADCRIQFRRTLEALLRAPVKATLTHEPLIEQRRIPDHDTVTTAGLGCHPDIQS